MDWLAILLDSGYFIRNKWEPLLAYLSFCVVIGVLFSLAFAFSSLLADNSSLEGLVFVLRFLVSILLQCGLLVFIDAIGQQRRISPVRAVMIAAPKLFTYLVAKFLVSLAVLVGLIGLILPGLLVYARLLLVDFLIVLGGENRPLSALLQSFSRTAGNTMGLVMIILFCIFPIFLISWVGVIHQIQNPTFLVRLLWMLVGWMLIILWAVVRYRCYLLLKES